MSEFASLQPGDPERLGDYPLAGRLGEGGQGVVYLGHDPDGEKVAVKLLRTRLDRDGKAHARFAREVAIAERVAPFCTARVITADLAGETPYVVSEYIDGPSLQASVNANGPLTGAALDRLAVSTATALAAIHEAGIVHRDFKPGNVLLAPDGPRVIDFGIARVLDATSTFTSQIIGTPAFMSPEQINGEEIGPPSDMFAWGSTIVYAATGASPFGGDTFPAVLNRVMNREPDLGVLTGPLRDIVTAALNKDPTQRPTPRQVLDHMVRATTPTRQRPDATSEPTDAPSEPTNTVPPPTLAASESTHVAPPPTLAASAPTQVAPPVTDAASAPPHAAPPPGQVAVTGLSPANGPAWGPPPTNGPAWGSPSAHGPAWGSPPIAPVRPAVEPQLLGAGLGGLVGLYLLTATLGRAGTSIQVAMHLTGLGAMFITCLVAAALGAPAGVVLGGRRPKVVAVAGTGLLLAGSVLDAFAPGAGLLMTGRFVSGLGAGALVALVVVLSRTGPQRTPAIGVAAGLGVLALVLGPVLGGLLTTMIGWRFAFLVALPPLFLAQVLGARQRG